MAWCRPARSHDLPGDGHGVAFRHRRRLVSRTRGRQVVTALADPERRAGRNAHRHGGSAGVEVVSLRRDRAQLEGVMADRLPSASVPAGPAAAEPLTLTEALWPRCCCWCYLGAPARTARPRVLHRTAAHVTQVEGTGRVQLITMIAEVVGDGRRQRADDECREGECDGPAVNNDMTAPQRRRAPPRCTPRTLGNRRWPHHGFGRSRDDLGHFDVRRPQPLPEGGTAQGPHRQRRSGPRGWRQDQRLLNCEALRAFLRPAFLRSTTRASRVSRPAFLSAGRLASMSMALSERATPRRRAPA